MKKIRIIEYKWKFYIICCLFMLSACGNFIEIPVPENQIVSATAFANDNTALATINGIYSKMMSGPNRISSSAIMCYNGMSADELYYYTASTRDEFIFNNITSNSNTVLNSYLWVPAYNEIYAANSCIEGALSSESISEATKNIIIGEALFVRSFIYFNLINLFGDVPLVLTTDFTINKDLPRESVASIYEQIEVDLLTAIDLLLEEYTTSERVRPNKKAAQALLARLYLYQNDWVNAMTYANHVLADDKYKLEDELSQVFLSSSLEAIWQLAPVRPNINSYDGNLILPLTNNSAPTFLISEHLLSSFELEDKRREHWVQSRVYRNQTLYYPYKYRVRTNSVVTEYNMVIRLAEMYLIRAEAKAQLNDIEGSLDDLNTIRARAGIESIVGVSNQNDLLNHIYQERRIEYFAEWGHRWFDLKRTDKVNEVIGQIQPDTWTPHAALYPIPYSQIHLNPRLTQNEGY